MSTRNIHGTDCFEVEAFIDRNEVSKLYKVRHKANGQFYSMEVAPRKNGFSPRTINTSLQEMQYHLSKFWLNLKFTFQTSSKLYFILEYIGETTLESLARKYGQLPEDLMNFYASEMLVALEEIHSRGLFYGELGLDKVYVDNTGHVVLWRNFCGKKYWTRSECIYCMNEFSRGNICENSHEKISEREVKTDYQLLGMVLLQLLSQEHLTSILNNKMSPREWLSRISSNNLIVPSSMSVFARDLVTRLLKGQFYNSAQIKSHPFFLGVNWKMVQARLTTPPAMPHRASYRPTLRKTSSEACIVPQRQMLCNDSIPIPPPYARPLTPSTITNPVNLHSPGNSTYPQHHRQNVPPPRILRSTLSSPDLTGFGREVDNLTWSRDQPSEALFQPIRPDYHSPPSGISTRYGLHSQSMSDLNSINAYGGSDGTYGRQRTLSRLSDTTPTLVQCADDYEMRQISQHFSFPPGNISFDRERDDYVGNHGGPVHQQSYPSTANRFSRNIDPLPNSFHDFSHAYHSSPYHANTNGLTNDRYYPTASTYGHQIDNMVDNSVVQSTTNLRTLYRSRSCSELNFPDADQQRRTADPRATPTLDNTERRKHYPLAQIPIPSFAEFKRKNSRTVDDETKKEEDVNIIKNDVHRKTLEFVDKKEVKNRANKHVERNKNSAMKMQQNGEQVESKTKLRDKHRSTDILTSRQTPRKTEDEKAIKSTSSVSKNTTVKQNDYYSHNYVIHNLMLKYGLYERSEKKRENKKALIKTTENEIHSSKLGSSVLESPRKRESKEHPERIEKENHESFVSTTRNEKTTRSPRSDRRRSAVAQQLNQPPPLTRKSRSTLGPNSQSESSEDPNNNTKTTVIIKEELLSPSSPTFSLNALHHKEMNTSRTDLLSIADVYKTPIHDRKTPSPDPSTFQSVHTDNDKNPNLRTTSKTIWAAAKFKLKLGKSPGSSPIAKRKSKGENDDVTADRNENSTRMKRKNAVGESSFNNISDEIEKSPRSKDSDLSSETSLQLPSPGRLQKGGLHTSLLSIASSAYSTDFEFDDSCSLNSECIDSERSESTSNRRRWESFHSSVSTDSGSAHMYEFENESMEGSFGENEKQSVDRKKSDSEIERTDSGIGGDIGRNKQSWEDIVLKSSKRWSIVAASAHHWQDLAKKAKEIKETTVSRKRSGTQTITEDMVECYDCQKYFLPEAEKHDGNKETSPSKNSTTICARCTERRVERKEAIIELVQTEINYANDLQILKEEFYSPLQSGGILQPENLPEIFLNLQELVEVSTKFSSRLEEALEASVSTGNEEFSQVNVGSIFLESVDFFQSYEIYCTKQNAASALLETLQKKNELLKIFLNVTCRQNPKCRKMDLNSFLLAPVQRIMKYPLLLSRIRKATPRRNPDREKLMQAQRKIEEQLNRINALNSTVESRQRRYRGSGHLGRSDSLDKLQMKKMASEILNWSMGELHLLMHGVFEVVIHEFVSSGGWSRRGSKKATDIFMLFCVRGLSEAKPIDSDDDNSLEEPLFPSEADATDAALVLLRKKLNGKYTLFKEPLSLHSCVICKDSDQKDCFEVINMSRETYIFKASTTKESKKWLKHLRLQAKDLGAWKKRRNGLPNIMIKTI